MCVILAIGPNVDIEEQKIISACEVNNDGYGMTVINDGKFETIKSITPNKPDELMKRLQDARGHARMVHLRFRTDGDISEDNCHPFVVTTKADHGLDIQFMHNGVISEFSGGKDAESDTWKFNELILKPLLKRTLKDLDDPEKWSEDPLVRMVLHKYASVSNVFTVYDPVGGHIVTNKSKGAEYDGWWASNSYSFNRHHRSSNYSGSSAGYYDKDRWVPFGNGGVVKDTSTSSTSCSVPAIKTDTKTSVPFVPDGPKEIPKLADHRRANQERLKAAKTSADGVKRIIAGNVDTAKFLKLDIIPPEKRPTFQDVTGLELDSLAFLELQDIDDLVTAHPELTTILIMDLLFDRSLAIKATKDQTLQQGVG